MQGNASNFLSEPCLMMKLQQVQRQHRSSDFLNFLCSFICFCEGKAVTIKTRIKRWCKCFGFFNVHLKIYLFTEFQCRIRLYNSMHVVFWGVEGGEKVFIFKIRFEALSINKKWCLLLAGCAAAVECHSISCVG